jgi:chaperonin GroEL
MSAKIFKFSFAARDGMLRGIDALAGAVGVTLGPKGRNVAIETSYGAPRVTKDGVTVAKEIELADQFENAGALLVREVAARTSYLAGDGTTTAVVLAHAMIREGIKAVAAGMNPMDLKRGIDMAVEAVVADLKKTARMATSNAEIAQVGAIAANGDAQIGGYLADAMRQVGKDGLINIEDGRSLATELEVVQGLCFDRGYLSPHFITEPVKRQAVMDDAYVLVCGRKLSNLKELLPLMELVFHTLKPLVVIAEDVEPEVLAALVVNKRRGTLRLVAVKSPGYGELGKAMSQDIAILTGATMVSDDLGLKLENVTLDHLGRAKTVTIDRQMTTIFGGGGHPAAIAARVAEIKAQIETAASDYDLDMLQQRLAKLSGGIAVLRVGGATELEMRERKDRVDDALNAARAAVAEGILPGGGVALLRAGRALDHLVSDNADRNAGIAIVRTAIGWPARQIAINAGEDGSVVVGRILEKADGAYGYDAQSGDYGDLIAKGIIDPAKVVRSALQGAASVAGLLITTEAMVAERDPKVSATLHDDDHHHGHDMEF